MPAWEDVVGAHDLEVARRFGQAERMGLGQRPALLVVDVTYLFTGLESLPVLEAVERWPFACGAAAWDAVASIARVRDAARHAGLPVVYTRDHPPGPQVIGPGRWADKGPPAAPDALRNPEMFEIVREVAPAAGELVIDKAKPSAFFGTALAAALVDWAVDSLVVVGGTTSGCVRATVVDAFSLNYRTWVVQEATFDRSDISHRVSLFDIDMKYGDVVDEQTVIDRLADLRSEG